MKESKRALRRHHRQRMIRRALRSFVINGFQDEPEDKRLRALRWYNNLKKCSCYLCGNPRKHFDGPPRQEQRIHEAARWDEIEFLGEQSRDASF